MLLSIFIIVTLAQSAQIVQYSWIESPASNDNISNHCAPRPCANLEICIPKFRDKNYLQHSQGTNNQNRNPQSQVSSTSGHYACVPFKVKCPDAYGHVTNGDVTVNGTNFADIATVTCRNGFVPVPLGVSMALECQVSLIENFEQ